jgi:hypothetical protein
MLVYIKKISNFNAVKYITEKITLNYEEDIRIGFRHK